MHCRGRDVGSFSSPSLLSKYFEEVKKVSFLFKIFLNFFLEKTTTSSWDWRKFLTRAKNANYNYFKYQQWKVLGKGESAGGGQWNMNLFFWDSVVGWHVMRAKEYSSVQLNWRVEFRYSVQVSHLWLLPPVIFPWILESRRCLTTFWLRQYSLLLLLT